MKFADLDLEKCSTNDEYNGEFALIYYGLINTQEVIGMISYYT